MSTKILTFEVVQVITRHAKQLAPGTRFTIKAKSSRVHVDRWLKQRKIVQVPDELPSGKPPKLHPFAAAEKVYIESPNGRKSVAPDILKVGQRRYLENRIRLAFQAGVDAGFRLANPQSGVCSICGCTDVNCLDCLARTGDLCTWVNADHTLCSACDL
jgi:hypothetical protein